MDIEEEIKEIVNDTIQGIPPVVFPEVQRVEVTNFPEQMAPVVNVEAPIVNVPAPIVNVPAPNVTVNAPEPRVVMNSSAVVDAISQLTEEVKRPKPTNEDILDAIESLSERIVKGVGSLKIQGPQMGVMPQTLQGTLDNGSQKLLASTPEGHLEVAIHGPRLPFGSLHAENLTPIFQSDAVYGVNSSEVLATTGLSVGTGANSGTATASANNFVCTTGTTAYSFGTLQSRKRLRYRAGQGLIGRFAGLFSTPAASSILVAGFGTAEAGYFTQMFEDDVTLQPGESITLAVRSVTATAVCIGSLNTREDQ